MSSWTRVGTWEGGYVRRRANGRLVYVIERVVKGRRFHIATPASTLNAAVRQLARFEADPTKYHPAGEPVAVPVTISAELVQAYQEHQVGKGNSVEWTAEMVRCLGDWAEALGGRDLRTLSLHQDVRPALDRWPKRKSQRIKALKTFYGFLRREKGLVHHSEDCTVDLKVPQGKPAKWKRRRAVDTALVVRALRELRQPYRDILLLLTATGWHVSEARRFSSGGEIVRHAGRPDGVIAVLITLHKGGEPTRTPIYYPEHLEAAVHLRGLPRFPARASIARVMKKLCTRLGIEQFRAGVMRHSVLSWAHDLGATAKETAEFAQHESDTTTRRHYLDLAVPRGDIPILRLTKA